MMPRADELRVHFNRVLRGSGFDAGWDAEQRGPRVRLTAGYHPMDDHGYYEPWIHFAVWVRPGGAFRLTFDTARDRRRAGRRMLRDYLEECVAAALESFRD